PFRLTGKEGERSNSLVPFLPVARGQRGRWCTRLDSLTNGRSDSGEGSRPFPLTHEEESMRKFRISALMILTMLPFVAAANAPSAGARTNVLINRFAPSGNKAVYDTKNAAVLKFGGAVGITPSPNSNGCSNSSATNVRANQECTNQDQAGVFGRGVSQNETAAAVNPTDPQNILLGQNDYSFGDWKCG